MSMYVCTYVSTCLIRPLFYKSLVAGQALSPNSRLSLALQWGWHYTSTRSTYVCEVCVCVYILFQSQSLLIPPPPFFPLSRCGRGSCFGGGLEVSCSIPARSKGLCPSQPDTECKCVRVHVHTYICTYVRLYVCTYSIRMHAGNGSVWSWRCVVCSVMCVCALLNGVHFVCIFCCLVRVHVRMYACIVHACIVHTCMYNT